MYKNALVNHENKLISQSFHSCHSRIQLVLIKSAVNSLALIKYYSLKVLNTTVRVAHYELSSWSQFHFLDRICIE